MYIKTILLICFFLSTGIFVLADTASRPLDVPDSVKFNQGVDLYSHRQYFQAKILFSELVSQHYRQAYAWLKKVDRAILADQIKSQREARMIKKLEEQRQEKLIAELNRQKRLYEKERMIQLRNEIKVRQEQERQAKSKEKAEIQEDTMHQQALKREEKTKQEQLIREEERRKEEFIDQEQQRQSQLKKLSETVREQLEGGVEDMYQDALRLYGQGDYPAAAQRFKDVQDILPGYKNTVQYMDKARRKSSRSHTDIVPDNVSQALNLFDPNTK